MIIIESGKRDELSKLLIGDELAIALELYAAADDVSFYEAAESPQYGLEEAGRSRARLRLLRAREAAEKAGLSYQLAGFLI